MKNIAEILVTHNIVKTNFKKPFIWVSGIHSPIYCDCRELVSIPSAREEVVNAFIDLISRENFTSDVISGTATAGIPWAAFVAQKLKKPMLYVRPKPKDHGTGKQVEGRGERGKNILVIEDALSTAGSSIKSAQALRNELDAKVKHIMAIFSWDTPEAPKFANKASLKLWPLTNFSEIAEALKDFGKISDQEYEELIKFHSDPVNWWKK